MKAEKSAVPALARWFVEEYLGGKWDYRSGGMHLAHARRLLSPGKDRETGLVPPAYTAEDVKDCLEMMRDGIWTDAPSSIRVMLSVFWGAPPFITRIPPPIPSVHDIGYDDWVKRWGTRAIARGVWDGVYRGWDGISRTPRGPRGLRREELRAIVGTENLYLSLEEYLATTKH